jgi:uncharacterized protein (DUF1697 family)
VDVGAHHIEGDGGNRRLTGCDHLGVTTHVAFLRAVNVGRRKVAMGRVVEILEDLQYEDVWTHANSGNVVLDTRGSRATIEQSIEHALETAFGFEITTFVRTATELHKAVHLQPFPVAAGDTYFITFLTRPSRRRACA